MSLARESREQTDAWNQRLEVSMREQVDQAESELKKTVEAQAQEVESVLQAELETELKRSELQHQDAIAATVDAFKAANLQLTLEREQVIGRSRGRDTRVAPLSPHLSPHLVDFSRDSCICHRWRNGFTQMWRWCRRTSSRKCRPRRCAIKSTASRLVAWRS